MGEKSNISQMSSTALLKPGESVFFLGIGGIGMSALARYFNSRGHKVGGYDKTPSVLTKELEAEGMFVCYEDEVKLIDKSAALVVYTPAIPADHSGLIFYRNNGYRLLKRSDVLGAVTGSSFNICVAGTHGKTTTSALIAHVLRDSGFGCNAFLGGIATNYNSNFWSSEKDVCVAEADEYDRSFLKLNPDIAVITAMDPDHLDIYGTEKNMQDAFVEFTGKIKSGGLLIHKSGLPRTADFDVSNQWTYAAADAAADCHAKNVRIEQGAYVFDAVIRQHHIKNMELNMGGRHNIENCIAAIAVAVQLGIDEEKIKKAVSRFAGVKRRFEYILKNDKKVMIDDYAHHPEELRALINGAKELYPGYKCTVIFQPHLYSRTHDLADGFAEVLEMADEVILLPVYPARELPIEGVSSQMITAKMTNGKVMEKEEMISWIRQHNTELLVTAGAGDIDTLLDQIKKSVENKN